MKKLNPTFMIILFCLVTPSNGQIIHVPSDQPSIQAGINAATEGDTVLVADSTYYENINFKGKAITVASHFLVDSNESHISNTIIDGSQPSDPDSASVVMMVSGEDTTSILCGFTITGGSGTRIYSENNYHRGGGGILIWNSGGKIESNFIKGIEMSDPDPADMTDESTVAGFGILAYVYNNKTLIIRNNNIYNNSFTGTSHGMGAGLFLWNGPVIVEGNNIHDNIINSYWEAVGGGIFYMNIEEEGYNFKLTVRNNQIYGNDLSAEYFKPNGGAIFIRGFYIKADINIHNNLIYDNAAHGGSGGGIASWEANSVIYNNTIVNNVASAGKEIGNGNSGELYLFNNILWSDSNDGITEIINDEVSLLEAKYCNIKGGWEGPGNIDVDPMFETDSFGLAEGSLCIGRGADSILVDGSWIHAPEVDLYNNDRPYASADGRVDLGAIESPYDYPLQYQSESIVNIPGEAATIQNGINEANQGDTVLVAPGLYYENINFKGKAITVASHFVMDGEEMNTTNTVIDGSQPINPDTTSVVCMFSGEDSTSVLCGFTITGGGGTRFFEEEFNRYALYGGGVAIFHSGGKIINNTIRNNHIEMPDTILYAGGCGIAAIASDNHNAVIRKNKIINNTCSGDSVPVAGGVGIARGGNIIVEYNQISNNEIHSEKFDVIAAGLGYWRQYEDFIPTVIIRNNEISWNRATSNYSAPYSYLIVCFGGGIFVNGDGGQSDIRIYNNLIHDNYSGDRGGGMFIENVEMPVFNNTLANNVAEKAGNSVFIRCNSNIALFNNIIWPDADNNSAAIKVLDENNTLEAMHNNIQGGWTGEGNISMDPGFSGDSFELSESSPCVGMGIDSVYFNSIWYHAPGFDFYGNPRPDPVDEYIDLGAIESPYKFNPPTGVQLDKHVINLVSGISDTLNVTYEPSDTPYKLVTWASSNDQVAIVNNGVVTGVAEGNTYIYATTIVGNFTDSCLVTVVTGINDTELPVFSIYPNPTSSNFTLDLKIPVQGEIEIHNLNGQLIYSRPIKSTSEIIDISSYPNGIYVISVRSDAWVRTEKVVKYSTSSTSSFINPRLDISNL